MLKRVVVLILLKENLKKKIVGIVSLIIPLFVSAYHRAEDLADAMEARGYSPGKERTRFKQLKVMPKDVIVLTFSFSFMFCSVFMSAELW